MENRLQCPNGVLVKATFDGNKPPPAPTEVATTSSMAPAFTANILSEPILTWALTEKTVSSRKKKR